MINPILFFGNVYDCYPVTNELREINNVDQLWLNYYDEYSMLNIATHFFKRNEQYTLFVYVAPDLVVTQQGINHLMNQIEKYNHPIISACCVVDKGNRKLKEQ